MSGKTVSLICKIAGVAFSILAIGFYLWLTRDNAKSDVIFALSAAGLIIANLALPVDISKVIENWRGTK